MALELGEAVTWGGASMTARRACDLLVLAWPDLAAEDSSRERTKRHSQLRCPQMHGISKSADLG